MSFLTYLENMLLFFDYQLKSYNKQWIYDWGRKSEKHKAHIISSYLCFEVNFLTRKMQFVIAFSCVISEFHTLKWECRFSKGIKVLIDSNCSFRNTVNFIQELKSYLIKHQFPAPSTQNKSRKSLKKMIQLLKNQKQ